MSAFSVARAQESDEQRQRPPTEIPDFSNLDEYIYEPKSSVRLGFRSLGGVTASFSGTGSIQTPEDFNQDLTRTDITRSYHDGTVSPDARTTARLDDYGNPMIDPHTGNTISDPIAPDGKTNTWNYSDSRQVDSDHTAPGYIAFHSYSAEVTDQAVRSQKSRTTNGLDLMVARDMGKLLKGRVSWNLIGGISVNDISARKIDTVAGTIQEIADHYSLFGRNPPDAPYEAPSSSTTTSGTSGTSVTVDSSVLISQIPLFRQIRDVAAGSGDSMIIRNNWKVKGAYYTFRGGAEVWIPITSRLRLNLTLAAAIIYSGTNYTVIQSLTPEIGSDIIETDTSDAYKLLPGYYADASLQFDLTEKTGFFAGVIYQSAGSYTQTIDSDTAHYSTKVDFKNLNGMRAGMSVRF
ncbi:hypothetical protein [Opitutus sp. ER46]|uniref:hypothetical protein n=1 Tax=Opitutus sp. ER46 TaxID=2161864 RepID=UPI0011B22C27|nr:hypothetical protein [Opitutus sp. ER46]